MRSKKIKIVTLILGIIFLISSCILIILNAQNFVAASANTSDDLKTEEIDALSNVAVIDSRTIVKATFNYVKLNDTECSVKIANKSDATVANIPNKAIIDGKEYSVTEIAANGFMSSTNLKRVSISPSIKKIGNNAFANCTKLERIALSRVETIGGAVFINCTSLKDIRVPETVLNIGANAFRNANTYVHVVASQDFVDGNWTSTWNSNNKCTEAVDYNTKFKDPTELTEIFDNNARSMLEEPIGYFYATGQPISSETVNNENYEDLTEYENGTYFIPSTYNDKPILAIEDYAFMFVDASQIVIEYSSEPISIGSYAFAFLTYCENITINRDVVFEASSENDLINSVFTGSERLTSIIFPASITDLPENMFAGCTNLTNIVFRTPTENISRKDLISLFDVLISSSEDGVVDLRHCPNLTTINSSAFESVNGIKEFIISSCVMNVGHSVFNGWDNVNQYVHIYNDGPLPDYVSNEDGTFTGWHMQWFGSFTNYKLEKEFVKMYLDPNGGEVDSTVIDVELGVPINNLPTPEHSTATFDGWVDADGKIYDTNTVLNVKDSIHLTAKWVYIVKYINGITTNTIKCEVGQIVTLPTYTKLGHKGVLKENATKSEYNFGNRYTPTYNTTFTVIWTELSIKDCYGKDTVPYDDYWYTVYTPGQLKELRRLHTKEGFWPHRVKLGADIDLTNENWEPFEFLKFEFWGNGYTISFEHKNVTGNENYGFVRELSGKIHKTKFKASIKTSKDYAGKYLGIIAGKFNGGIYDCEIISVVGKGSGYYNSMTDNKVDILIQNRGTITGGFAGLLEAAGGIQDCTNRGVSIASRDTLGGIVGESKCYVAYCKNSGELYYEMDEDSSGDHRYIGGISGIQEANWSLMFCEFSGTIRFVSVLNNSLESKSPCIGQIVGLVKIIYTETTVKNNDFIGRVITWNISDKYLNCVSNNEVGYTYDPNASSGDDGAGSGGCVAPGTLITLADGSQKQVEHLTGSEMLLVWNLYTGTFDVAPILFIDSESSSLREVIYLYFSDGTEVKVISEHAFWDFDLNEYVFLRNDASKYIGHWYNKQVTDELGNMGWLKVQLMDVVIKEEVTTSWSPVTYGHLCYYVNGMLSMPGATEGLINIFEVNNETLKINEELMQYDIETYGLYTYEEFAEIYPITKEIFEAFGGQYLKISMGKGLITLEEIGELISHYAEFLN